MARITIYLSDDLRAQLDAAPDVNASAVFRRAITAELAGRAQLEQRAQAPQVAAAS